MLAIFGQVEQDHIVSSVELSSLRTLIAHPYVIGMPDYVLNLAEKVVNGDPANIYLKSAASATGNIFAGCAASQLRSLVSDWFDGSNPVTMTNSSATMTWVSGVLFAKGGPKYTDIYQGVIGDCTLLAGLAEVALRRPGTIQSMFINNSDGTLTVRLYHNGVADYVTVNTQLPNSGQLYDRVTNGVMWAALVEKAVVEENESGRLGTISPGSNSYAALNGGNAETAVAYLAAITGLPSTAYAIDPANIAAAWQANKLVVLSTGAAPPGSNLVSQHAYAMVGYNSTSATPVTLFNPWGITFGQVSVSPSTLTTSFEFAAAAGSALESSVRESPTVEPSRNATEVAAEPLTTTAPPLSASGTNRSTQNVGQDSTANEFYAIDEFFATWAKHADTPLQTAWTTLTD
jgi:hypothetical protein